MMTDDIDYPLYEPSDEELAHWAAEEEEHDLVERGLLMRLTHCYLCYLETTGKADTSPKGDQGPLRGIIREYTTKGFDPYAAVEVTPCGHHLI